MNVPALNRCAFKRNTGDNTHCAVANTSHEEKQPFHEMCWRQPHYLYLKSISQRHYIMS